MAAVKVHSVRTFLYIRYLARDKRQSKGLYSSESMMLAERCSPHRPQKGDEQGVRQAFIVDEICGYAKMRLRDAFGVTSFSLLYPDVS